MPISKISNRLGIFGPVGMPFRAAWRSRNRMILQQLAIVLVLLAASKTALAGGWAFMENTTCQGDPIHVRDRNAAIDLGADSYLEEGSEDCDDISKVEVMVVVGTRGGGERLHVWW